MKDEIRVGNNQCSENNAYFLLPEDVYVSTLNQKEKKWCGYSDWA